MRYFLFYAWLVISLGFGFWAVSEYVFSDATVQEAKLFGLRMICALFWPLAILSQGGRQILLTLIKG